MEKVVGYIILNENGEYLTEGLSWLGPRPLEFTFVHPVESMDEVIEALLASKSKSALGEWLGPTTRVSATWSLSDGVVITGEPESFLLD